MARHATNLEKLKLGNIKKCNGRSTHQGATRKLNSMTSRVEEVCWKNACMHDVHNTCPPSPMKHNHKGLALCSRCHASEGTPVGPGKDTHGTLGPGKRRGRGWPTPTPQGRSTVSMTHAPDSTKHKSVRQTTFEIGIMNVVVPIPAGISDWLTLIFSKLFFIF